MLALRDDPLLQRDPPARQWTIGDVIGGVESLVLERSSTMDG